MSHKKKTASAHTRLAETDLVMRVLLRAFVVSLAFVVFVGLAAGVCGAQTRGPEVSIPSITPDLRVMTWNIEGRNVRSADSKKPCGFTLKSEVYLDNIEKEIKRHERLDVIALQEVYRSQAEGLQSRLKGYLGMAPKLYFAETVTCEDSKKDFGIALISRHPFADGSPQQGSLCFHIKQLLDLDLRLKPNCGMKEDRKLERVIINVEGRLVYIYNTHLGLGRKLEDAQAALILRQVSYDRDHRQAGFPFRPVLMGDFNVGWDTDAYRRLTRGSFFDTWRQADHDLEDCDVAGFTLPTSAPRFHADYVFAGDGAFKVISAHVTCRKKLFEEFGLLEKGKTSQGKIDYDKVPDHLPLVAHILYL